MTIEALRSGVRSRLTAEVRQVARSAFDSAGERGDYESKDVIAQMEAEAIRRIEQASDFGDAFATAQTAKICMTHRGEGRGRFARVRFI